MRILLDECVNPRLRDAFPGHYVVTVPGMGWRAVPDLSLLALANGKFDALITLDCGFEFEHNLSLLLYGIVIVHVARNRMSCYQPLFPALLNAVNTIGPGEVVHVGR